MKVWAVQVQESGESCWQEFEENSDNNVSNADVLHPVNLLVHEFYIEDVRVSVRCIDWQLGIIAEVFDRIDFVHDC